MLGVWLILGLGVGAPVTTPCPLESPLSARSVFKVCQGKEFTLGDQRVTAIDVVAEGVEVPAGVSRQLKEALVKESETPGLVFRIQVAKASKGSRIGRTAWANGTWCLEAADGTVVVSGIWYSSTPASEGAQGLKWVWSHFGEFFQSEFNLNF